MNKIQKVVARLAVGVPSSLILLTSIAGAAPVDEAARLQLLSSMAGGAEKISEAGEALAAYADGNILTFFWHSFSTATALILNLF